MLERDIERALIKHIESLGGTCEKFNSGVRNVPDRIITLPGNNISFVECKRPGAKPRIGQLRDHDRRRQLGCIVHVIDSLKGIKDAFPR
jgi:hypothetical protein